MTTLPQAIRGEDVKKYAPLALYIGTILAANWAITEFGMVQVGFSLIAPAGVFFAGLAFTFRDLTHETLGRWWVLSAILVGAMLSWWLSNPALAFASGVAFLCSETADLLVYEPIRKKHWLTAVALSNTVGLAVDSTLFLWLAFGSLEFIQGQLLGKFYMTMLAVLVLWMGRKVYREVLPRNTPTALA